MRHPKLTYLLAFLVTAGAVVLADDVNAPKTEASSAKPKYASATIRGKVVWMGEALERLYGIKTVAEAKQRSLALETSNGELIPLVEDVRGRAFRADKRLRGIEVELLVRKYEGSPLAQVIQVFAIKKDGKYEMDYWCEICAIAMVELKPCDCCQADIILRQRKVVEKKP